MTASPHTVPKAAFHECFQAWQNCCSKCVCGHVRGGCTSKMIRLDSTALQVLKFYGWILATLWYTYGTVLLAHCYSTVPTSEVLNVCDELFCSRLIEICVISCHTSIVLISWSSWNLQLPQFCFSVANRRYLLDNLPVIITKKVL